MSSRGEREWSEKQIKKLSQSLATVLLEEWGGPRSPLALQFLQETIIPDLLYCFRNNEDLLTNPTFAEIIAWKLRNQFAYPHTVVNDLAKDLLIPAQKLSKRPQINDPKEPWRRIFRLWVAGESLPAIAERTGYPLDYLDLLLTRLKKIRSFLAGNTVSLLECTQNPELREIGFEQLSFLYQFQTSFSSEPLYKERLILEQVILDLRLPLQVSDLVTLLEIVHTHEGKLEEAELILAIRKASGQTSIGYFSTEEEQGNLLSRAIEGLISLHYIQRNKAGKLALSEKSAQTIAGFLLPKLSEKIRRALEHNDHERARQILLEQNPEVLVRLIDWVANSLSSEQAFKLLQGIYQHVNKRIDLYLLPIFSKFEVAFELLMNSLGDKDSLIRARACASLGLMGNKDASFRLIQLLRDPVAGVREAAAQALGELGSLAGVKELLRITEDYGEPSSVRSSAREALKKIESHRIKSMKNKERRLLIETV